jgi:hypothetical protein
MTGLFAFGLPLRGGGVGGGEGPAPIGGWGRSMAALGFAVTRNFCISSSSLPLPFLAYTEPVLLNVYGAPELMPRNEFRQPM